MTEGMTAARLLQRHRTILSVGVVLLLAALGFAALDHLLQEVHLHQVRLAWHALPITKLLAAAGLTAISYLTLTLYDVLALRAIGRPLPYRTAALASFTSYTLSHNLGLSLLTGGSARYRVYSAAGLSGGDIARVVLIASATFWSGVFVLAGVMLVLRPSAITLDEVLLSPAILRGVGIVLLLGIGGVLIWAGGRGRLLRVRRWSLPVPPATTMIGQIGIGAIDLAA